MYIYMYRSSLGSGGGGAWTFLSSSCSPRDRHFIAVQPAPAPHLAHPEGRAALRIVLVTVPRVSRSCEHFLDGYLNDD